MGETWTIDGDTEWTIYDGDGAWIQDGTIKSNIKLFLTSIYAHIIC